MTRGLNSDHRPNIAGASSVVQPLRFYHPELCCLKMNLPFKRCHPIIVASSVVSRTILG